MRQRLKKSISYLQSRLKDRRGQVAIFVALIFQVLFLFFAMVINVGLLVHHKINLQNAVDLAAYYGATKQAENMNAIAHANYQIRQGWKLLTWRYRAIGSAGEAESEGKADPFVKVIPGKLVDAGTDQTSNDPKYQDFYDTPSFCITYVPFRPMPNNENTCRKMATEGATKLFKPPAVIAGFLSFSQSVRAASQFMLDNAIKRCEIMGSYNYLMLGKFVVTYNVDQADRMALITKISRATSESTTDFTDIDGDSVKDGIEKTLKKNLTYANNNDKLTFDVYNSLGNEACGGSGVAASRPPKWLNTIGIVPGFNFIDTVCSGPNALLNIVGKELLGGSSFEGNNCTTDKSNEGKCKPFHYDTAGLKSDIDGVKDFIGPRSDPDNINNYTLGVEKNPWCMAYVGVKAEAQPNIPFSPFGAIKLKARAFAKPFGGRIGPWFYKKWPRGYESTGSSANEQTDPLLPKRTKDVAQIGNPKERIVNYSRFIGDKLGLKSRISLGYSAQAIYKMDPQWQTKGDSLDVHKESGSPNFDHWKDLPFGFSNGKTGDPLAWGGSVESTPMRSLEIAAVAPDPFDMAYYSIEPDYYHNYYLRLKAGLLAKKGALSSPQQLRGDLGSRAGEGMDLESFSIKDQTRFIKAHANAPPLSDFGLSDKQTWISLTWQNTLTGWAEHSLIDYSLDTSKFGKCIFPSDVDSQPFLDPPSSGNCAAGGTSGYSVKLVGSEYLKQQDLQLGGESSGTGPIYNPPPDDW